jgi:hypothetical protein
MVESCCESAASAGLPQAASLEAVTQVDAWARTWCRERLAEVAHHA